jgi:hypothetical protein
MKKRRRTLGGNLAFMLKGVREDLSDELTQDMKLL